MRAGLTLVKRRPRYWFQARRRFWFKNYFIANSVFVTGFELRSAENPALKQASAGGDPA